MGTATGAHGPCAPTESRSASRRCAAGRSSSASSIRAAARLPGRHRNAEGAVAQARRVLGEDAFAVLTLGFDTRNDTPDRMAAFAIDHAISPTTRSGTWRPPRRACRRCWPSWASAMTEPPAASACGADDDPRRRGARLPPVYGDDYPVQVLIEPLKGTGLRPHHARLHPGGSPTACASCAPSTIPRPAATRPTTPSSSRSASAGCRWPSWAG